MRAFPTPMSEETARLLVVDDVEANRDLLSRRLKQQGHAVSVAENGRRALEMVRASPSTSSSSTS